MYYNSLMKTNEKKSERIEYKVWQVRLSDENIKKLKLAAADYPSYNLMFNNITFQKYEPKTKSTLLPRKMAGVKKQRRLPN